jgi:hypothetical protein
VYDQETRTALAQERIAQLHRDMQAPAYPVRRTRRAVGELLIMLGDRLAREAPQPCREVSSRA